ncbi:MAG: hypothetical protein AMXMBFR25_20250 [Lysobacterales bacterium]
MSCLLSCPALADDARSRFREIWQDEWEWRLQELPLYATSVGEHRYDDRLGEVDPRAQQRRLKYWRRVRKALAGVDVAQFDARSAIDFAIYRAQIDSFIANIELGSHEMPMNSDSAFYTDLAFLPRQQPLRTAAEVRRYITRLRAVPAWFRQQIEQLRAGLASGRSLPRVTLEGRDAPIARVAALHDPAESDYYRPLERLSATIAPAVAEELRAQARAAIAQEVIPAHRELLAFLRESYLPGARRSIAASALPNGAAWYRQQIRDYTTLDLDAAEIHRIGLAEVARIEAAMQAVMDELKYRGDLKSFVQELRSDPRFFAHDADELLAQAAWVAKRADGALPRFFGHLPRLPYGVQAVPDAIAPTYTGGRYVPPADGATEPGWYWVNTYDLPSRPLYTLPALTLHEAVPGHHLQHALALEQGEQPPFRRHQYISAYGEGWALYAEELGVEMGIYRTPYERFGQLSYAMWRACRLVIDTGIHAHGWSRQRAIDYLLERSALSRHEATTEVDRYISWPGQALSYMLGAIRIRELRREAETALGEGFDIRAFHDSVLATGSVPLDLLSEHVHGWIEMERKRMHARDAAVH